MNVAHEVALHDSPSFAQLFQEGYCKASVDFHESTEVTTDVDCSSPFGGVKPEEDGDDDDMLGGVFDFSEEGSNMRVCFSCRVCCFFHALACCGLYTTRRFILSLELTSSMLMFFLGLKKCLLDVAG